MSSLYCLVCGAQTEHLNVTRAAAYAGVSRSTMHRWISSGLVHVLRRPSGRVLVCTASLFTPGFERYPGDRSQALPWTVRG